MGFRLKTDIDFPKTNIKTSYGKRIKRIDQALRQLQSLV